MGSVIFFVICPPRRADVPVLSWASASFMEASCASSVVSGDVEDWDAKYADQPLDVSSEGEVAKRVCVKCSVPV